MGGLFKTTWQRKLSVKWIFHENTKIKKARVALWPQNKIQFSKMKSKQKQNYYILKGKYSLLIIITYYYLSLWTNFYYFVGGGFSFVWFIWLSICTLGENTEVLLSLQQLVKIQNFPINNTFHCHLSSKPMQK